MNITYSKQTEKSEQLNVHNKKYINVCEIFFHHQLRHNKHDNIVIHNIFITVMTHVTLQRLYCMHKTNLQSGHEQNCIFINT